jgi:hypothetical protein
MSRLEFQADSGQVEMLLYCCLQKAALIRHISFQRQRIPVEQIKQLLPEMMTVGFINLETRNCWKNLMIEHNRILKRGERVHLQARIHHFNVLWIKFASLDLYMLQMHSRYLSKLLDDLSNFGDRVFAVIGNSPSARFWILESPIIIERASWVKLCANVMSLLRVLGVEARNGRRIELRPWPDRDLLEASASRARSLFGQFAQSDRSAATISLLLRRPAAREPRLPSRRPATRAAGGILAKGKRGRLELEPAEQQSEARPLTPASVGTAWAGPAGLPAKGGSDADAADDLLASGPEATLSGL